jgi:hypothetical protein
MCSNVTYLHLSPESWRYSDILLLQMKSFDMPVLVVGNKVDLTREVEESEVEDIQKDWGCTYIGTCTTMLSSEYTPYVAKNGFIPYENNFTKCLINMKMYYEKS